MSSPGVAGSMPEPMSPPVTLEALAREAWTLEMPFPFERRSVLGYEAGRAVDALLARVARGSGALDVAMGDGLAALAVGDRVLRLGYSGIGDYARERLGIAGRTGQAMARLARELRARALLRDAVRRGEVSIRKAQAVLPAAVGGAEAAWVERARVETVRALEAAVREEVRGGDAGDGDSATGECPAEARAAGFSAMARAVDFSAGDRAGDPADEPWEPVSLLISPEDRRKLDEAMELAGRLLGAASPGWQRLEAVCQEYVGAHPAPVEAPRDGQPPDICGVGAPASGPSGEGLGFAAELDAARATVAGAAPAEPEMHWLDALKVQLEVETDRWAVLGPVEPVPATEGTLEEEADPWRLDAELRRLVAMRARWDELVGHLARLMQGLSLWRHIGFATFGQYCEERLGMAQRTVEQRAWLERRLECLPALRQAMREGRLSYEKARVVARHADEGSEEAWIEVAERSTCIALQREAEVGADAQMRARGDLSLRLPRRVARLLEEAFEAARRVAGRWLAPGECLLRVSEHFVETWGPALKGRATPQRRAVERDAGFCQVPGCSRAAAHAHHLRFRSAGGSDDAENLVALCAAHHLHGVHRGWVRVRGRAPDRLVWELGEAGVAA